MINVDNFLKSIRSFSNSLVIKFEDVAYQMEQYRLQKMMPSRDNRANWKYYMSIAGEEYLLDETIEIKVIETEKVETLTKELLDQYPLTKLELKKFGDYYKDIITAYPEHTLYIHGCIWPVDKQTAMDAEDGTILAYDTSFLQSNEDNVIDELESFIKGTIKRYYNFRYTITEELYLPSFLSMLYSFIPYKILNIMISNIKSYRANEFFLELYYRGEFDLWDNLKALRNKETIWWLYANLDRIIKHIGKNKTLDTILTKIFDKDNIGVGINYLKYHDPILKSNPYDPYTLPYEPSEPNIFLDKLNESFLQHDNKIIPLEDLLEEQIDLVGEYTGDRKEYVKETIAKNLRKVNYGTNTTKTLDLSTLENFTGWNLDVYAILLDYWTYLLSEDRFGSFTNDDLTTVRVDFLDPNTGRKYNINSKQGYYMFLKLILAATGNLDLKLSDVSVSNILDPDVNLEETIMVRLYQDGFTQLHKQYIYNNYPRPNSSYSSYLDVSEFLYKVIKFYKDIWILSCNSENSAVSGNLRMLIYLLSKESKIKIHSYQDPLTIDELLTEVGIGFDVEGEYDYMASIKELLKTVLGVTTDPNSKLEDLLKNLTQLFTKLTSYTLQIKGDITSDENVYVFYNNIQPFFTNKGIIQLDEERFLLEPNGPISFTTRYVPDSNDLPNVHFFEHRPILYMGWKEAFKGIGYETYPMEGIPDQMTYRMKRPTMHIERYPRIGVDVELKGIYNETQPVSGIELSNIEHVLSAEGLSNADDSVVRENIDNKNDIVLPDFLTTKK